MLDNQQVANELNKPIHNYEIYAAQQFANTIGAKEPKFVFKDKKVEKDFFNNFKNDIINTNYELIRLSSLHSCSALGVEKINDKLIFKIGRVLHIKVLNNEIIELQILIDQIKQENTTFFVLEKWEKNENIFLCERYAFNSNARTNLNKKDLSKLGITEKIVSPLKNKIPYKIFTGNPFNQPDLYNVPKQWMEDFDFNIDLLKVDSVVNRGLLLLNTGSIKTNETLYKKVLSAFKDPKTFAIPNDSNFSLISNNLLQMLQGQSASSSLIDKLNYLDQQIKKFGFMRTNSVSMGTKNTNNSEIEVLNADANDYLEMKANLLEINWKDFIETIYAPIQGFINTEVDVEVAGSTKFMKNPDNIYLQNQDGTLTNPNDLATQNNNNNKNSKENTNDKQQ